MPTVVTSLEQAYQSIQEAMKNEEWVKAYQVCLEVLRVDPENLKVIHLKNKIEKNVRKANQNAINEDIKKLEPLWKEHKYQELLTNLTQLEPYIKEYPAIKPLIIKAKQKYEEQLSQQLELNYQTEIKKIKELINAKNFKEALINCEQMTKMDLHSNELKKLQAKIREQWINNEIESNKILLSGQKYENILLFYQKLLKIDPESTKIKYGIEQSKKAQQTNFIDEKKEFLYKSLEQMRTLYQIKKYEKTLLVCAEILAIDPDNKVVKSFQKKSDTRTKKLIDNEVIVQMISNQKALKEELKTNPGAFIKI